MLGTVQAAAQRINMQTALVGGAVRDGMLGQPVDDLDFVVQGDAPTLVRALAQAGGGQVLVHDHFRTASWSVDTQVYDFATARTERYSLPGSLPIITPSSIHDDLRRRDFSINAMAMLLEDGSILDPFNGKLDLQARRIRALHEKSFVDDPTRIFRAARYAARFNFALDAPTRTWIGAGVEHIRKLSGERVKCDLELIFDETTDTAAIALNSLVDWEVFKQLAIPAPTTDAIHTRIHNAAQRVASGDWRSRTQTVTSTLHSHAIGWGTLIYNMGQLAIRRWIDWLPLPIHLRDALISLGALSIINRAMFTGKPSSQSALLKDFSELALFIGWLFDPDPHKRQAMHNEWHLWRPIKPLITGDDLRAAGLTPGPAYATILAALRAAWIDGDITTAATEATLLAGLISRLQSNG